MNEYVYVYCIYTYLRIYKHIFAKKIELSKKNMYVWMYVWIYGLKNYPKEGSKCLLQKNGQN
jgi:hypothetical protein